MVFALLSVSCTTEPEVLPVIPSGAYQKGIIALNEGGFQKGNASVSFINEEWEVEDDIFERVTKRKLGDTAQSITFHEALAFIVVNGTNTIEIVNRYTFEAVHTIDEQLINPRYITVVENKGYVTNWGDPSDSTDDFIAEIDLSTYAITQIIPVAEGPEHIAAYNQTLFVVHKGGWSHGNTVSSIDLSKNFAVQTIMVGDVPNYLAVVNDRVLVLCSGKPSWTGNETAGAYYEINAITKSVEKKWKFQTTEHPSYGYLYQKEFYYRLQNKIYKIGGATPELPNTAILDFSGASIQSFYGLAVTTTHFFIADAKDFNSKGNVFVFNKNGVLEKTLTVGFLPNSFYFN
jgi:DNA-binding beta-propeller fold protein YncE